MLFYQQKLYFLTYYLQFYPWQVHYTVIKVYCMHYLYKGCNHFNILLKYIIKVPITHRS